MTVAFDAASESNTGAAPLSRNHTSAAGARSGALILAHGTASTDLVTGATINGVTLAGGAKDFEPVGLIIATEINLTLLVNQALQRQRDDPPADDASGRS